MRPAWIIFVLFLLLLIPAGSVASAGKYAEYLDSEGRPAHPEKWRPPQSPAKPRKYLIPEGITLYPDVAYEYYPVFGHTITEFVNSSLENGPIDRSDNKRHASSYRWMIGWSFDYDFVYIIDEISPKIHVSIEISNIQIEDKIVIILPTLLDDSALNPIEKNLWKNYFDTLLTREHDHVAIIRDSVLRKEFTETIEGIAYLSLQNPGQGDIDAYVDRAIRLNINLKGKEFFSKLRNRLQEYERITERGKKPEMRDSFFSGTKTKGVPRIKQ